MSANRFIEYLKNVEGFRSTRYIDSAGYLTIGYGHKLDEGEQIYIVDPGKAEDILVEDTIQTAKKTAKYVDTKFGKGTWKNLTAKQQGALVDITFNVGSLHEFPKFTQAVVSGDIETARKESKRYYTTPAGEKKELSRRNRIFESTFLDEWS